MKNQILSITIILFSLTFISCNESIKNNWSDSDKESFRSDMRTAKELNAFAEYKSEFIECYLSKCEDNYSSYFFADTDEEGCTKLALECGEEVFSNGSIKGNWSDDDIRQYHQEMQNIEELNSLGEYKAEWIQCYLKKAKNNYSSLYSANLDEEGCTQLAEECNKEIFGL